ncbi:glycine oxidase ThiO [Paenibacillus sp. FSL W8-1187]|uniref:glycine oxidase n=1 Tax=Paenibacillus pasadenensis TaxID=217090 RepID=A0A2N5N493_9BACL|nr:MULTISPECIES: glycine oxidase ThiO [Paenibacillus]PLT45140.1 Glycine oxidase ThiO [Paenibacillus pasadenensis]QGG55536.1 glycine oxidase ThiO [Paenibacillus sp. B01]
MKERVLILGGGIIGLACAFEAASDGSREVTVVERGGFGGQATGAAAGMLAPFSENVEQPDAFFELCLDSLRRYPEWVERIEERSGMEAGLRRTGSLGVALHEADLLPLQSRLRWQRAAGSGAELLTAAQAARLEPRLAACAGGIYTPAEAHVDAPQLAAALEQACRSVGVRLRAGQGGLASLELRPGDAPECPVALTTERGERFEGDRLVLCAGAWSGEFERLFGLPETIHPIRGQICAYGVPDGEVRHMVFTSQAYWVGKSGGRLVCGASEDVAGFCTDVTDRGIGRLERWSARAFPMLAGMRPSLRWAGLRPATRDGRPLIGRLSGYPQVLFAAGHYRNGILLAPATAAAVLGLLEGDELAASAAFHPERFRRGFSAHPSGAFAPSAGAGTSAPSRAEAAGRGDDAGRTAAAPGGPRRGRA